MCVEKERTFECRPETAPAGRRFVADSLRTWGLDAGHPAGERLADVVLVTGELLANAVEACAKVVRVELQGHRDYIEVCVHDDNPMPAVPSERGPMAGSGRGLLIVERLSSEWGQVAHDGKTKRIWCRIPIQPTTDALSAGCRLV